MWLACLSILISHASAQVRFVPHKIDAAPGSRGAVFHGSEVFAWGDGLWRMRIPGGKPRKVASGNYGPAGCIADINSDGSPDLVLRLMPDRMVWLAGPDYRRSHTIDTGADFADCMEATLLGHRGILVTHRGMQIRLYEIPAGDQTERWTYREIYSFYTASYQSGLIVKDVDGDGIPDLISGNYWIRSPEQFDLPWRLYAINTYNETPHSAHVRLAQIPEANGRLRLLVSQGEAYPGRLAMFTPPSDAQQLWTEQRLDGDLNFNLPAAIAVADLDKNGRHDFLVAERGGKSPRLWWWRQLPESGFRAELIAAGRAVHSIFVADLNHDGRSDLVTVGPRSAVRFENMPLR